MTAPRLSETPDIETVLLSVLMNEYGGEREDWTGMGSLRRVAQALAPILAAAVREARAAELREAADEAFGMDYPSSQDPAHWGIWLRHRADRIDVDAPEGGA